MFVFSLIILELVRYYINVFFYILNFFCVSPKKKFANLQKLVFRLNSNYFVYPNLLLILFNLETIRIRDA